MRKRIAVFANGWGCEYLQKVVGGIAKAAYEEDMDVFSFVDFSAIAEGPERNNSELNIFRLPDLNDFDGAVVLANSFNMAEEIAYIKEKLSNTPIPTISLEYELEGAMNIISDNFSGMYDLTRHLIKEHNVKEILYLGGPADHPENQVRLQAVLKAMGENNLLLPDEYILYSDWAPQKSTRIIGEWIEEHKKVPEAIVCANDTMAIAVCDYLLAEGYDVPGDVKVTGYDCIHEGQEKHPVLTTVNHEWKRMGYVACKMLSKHLRGEEELSTKVLSMETTLVCGESCGCNLMQHDGKSHAALERIIRTTKIDPHSCDSHYRHMYQAVRKAENKDELIESLSGLFAHEHWMEGESFLQCLEKEFFVIRDNDDNLRTVGYGDEVEVVSYNFEGKRRDCGVYKTREILFALADGAKEPGNFIIVPCFSEGKTYGFSILGRDMEIALDKFLYSWTRHMNQGLEQVRRNLTIAALTERLRIMSVHDVLTGVYNRFGCEQIAYPMLTQWHKEGGTGIILLADMDGMKKINDHYGHAYGDLALKTVATSLKEIVPSDWIVSRFGGDEFFVGGCVKEKVDPDELIQNIYDRIHEKLIEKQIEFEISVSIGIQFIYPEDEIELEKSLQKADEQMYEIKKVHHEEIAKWKLHL